MLEPALPSGLVPLRGGTGGFGTVYEDPADPIRVVKRLNHPLTDRGAAELLALLRVYADARLSDRFLIDTRFSWPTTLFGDGTRIEGLAFQRAPEAAYFDLETTSGVRQTLLTLSFVLRADHFSGQAILSPPPPITYQDRVQLAIDLIDAVAVLHRGGLVHGDISEKNVCIQLTTPRRVFLLDTDSIRTARFHEENRLKTAGWEPAKGLTDLEANRSVVALAVWRLLTSEAEARPVTSHAVVPPTLASATEAAHRTGSEHDLVLLRRALSDERDDLTWAAAVQQAQESGFARLVLRELPGSDAPFAELRDRALAWLVEEERAGKARGALRQALVERLERDGEFAVDLPADPDAAARRARRDVRTLVYELRFEDIARGVVDGRYVEAASDVWTVRAVQHALASLGVPRVTVAAGDQHTDFTWAWPDVDFVNVGLVTVSGLNGASATHAVPRRDHQLGGVRLPASVTGASISLRFGVRPASADPEHTILALTCSPPVTPPKAL